MKQRLDGYLVETGHFETKSKAQIAIKRGNVMLNGKVCTKPGKEVFDHAKIDVEKSLFYVGFDGPKLEKALNDFKFNVSGKTVLDIGAGMGGFTDCVLQNGAENVYCVDNKSGQLDEKISTDNRVKNIDNCSIKDLTLEHITNSTVDLITIDVSTLSLAHVFTNLSPFLKDTGNIIALVKPQVEASSAMMDQRGIVKDLKAHLLVLRNVITFAQNNGFYLQQITYAPVVDKRKNIEYVALFSKQNGVVTDLETLVKSALDLHKKL